MPAGIVLLGVERGFLCLLNHDDGIADANLAT